MYAHVLLVGGAVALLASVIERPDDPTQRAAQTVEVNVRIDCLAGRGVSFSLIPWAINVYPGDSIDWKLDPAANVDSVEIIDVKAKGWPFKKKPPYKATKTKPVGARDLDVQQKGSKYHYAVKAICIRSTVPLVADTVVIDPDIIIIRGGG